MHSLVTIPHLIQYVLTAGMLASVVYYVASYFATSSFFQGSDHGEDRSPVPDAALPAVTILKPLKGLDVDLFDNLSTFCRQDYGPFQIVFGVADADDPAVPVVRRLQAHYPTVRIDLVVDGRIYGTNYKISNLHNMYRLAQHDVIVIADSDIRVTPDYLRQIATQLQEPGVGIVTCLYRAVNTGGLPTLAESLFINTDFAPSVLLARRIETRRYAFGATIALRRAVLNEIGGFLSLANYLADDYYLGNRVAVRGYRVALSKLVVETVLAVGTWKRLLDHQLRWARTYRSSRPASYFALLMTHGTLWATLNLCYNHGSMRAALVSATVYALRIVTASTIANGYLHAPLPWREALFLLPKDLFTSAVWALAFLGDTVNWSGRIFRVLNDGQMVSMSPIGSEPALDPYTGREERDQRPASI